MADELDNKMLADEAGEKEGWGWLGLVVLMALFPLLFFVCVFIPIWLGITSS